DHPAKKMKMSIEDMQEWVKKMQKEKDEEIAQIKMELDSKIAEANAQLQKERDRVATTTAPREMEKVISSSSSVNNAPPPITNKQYFPSGQAGFKSIRENEQFFIDKSRFIEPLFLSRAHVSIFRPPRFGKSLMLDMMRHFFDIEYSKGDKIKEWEKLFEGMDCLKSEAFVKEHARKYHVLSLDFSGIDTSKPDEIYKLFNRNVFQSIEKFQKTYNLEFEIDPMNCIDSLIALGNHISKSKDNGLLILIDEYDNIISNLMADSARTYKQTIQEMSDGKEDETKRFPGAGTLRAFFEATKVITKSNVRQIFTGVHPIALADISGYNICKDVTFQYGDLFGFTKRDIATALDRIQEYLKREEWSDSEKEKALGAMTEYFNGSRFFGTSKEQPLYNPQLALTFLDNLLNDEKSLRTNILKNGRLSVDYMTDYNVTVGRSSLDMMQRAGQMIPTAVSLATIEQPLEARIVPEFKLDELLHPERNVAGDGRGNSVIDQSINTGHAWSLSYLYYNGAVT
ncbi:MAG: AAA family ATPase, partial [Chitinophagales bacterium]